MHAGARRALEFDRIVSVVAGLAVTPTGEERLGQLEPMTDATDVARAQRATTEGTKFLADHPGFPLRAPSDLEAIIIALGVEGRALEPLRLVGLADYLESIEQTRAAVLARRSLGEGGRGVAQSFPLLTSLVETVASFKGEIADVRRKIDPSGEVADNASPALAAIRERLRKQKSRLRSTLDSFLRGRDTSKYLQEQVVTDRNGRHVLMVRSEHRNAIPGIVHGGSTSGASLFVEPMETVEINNEIVELEEQEAEEVRRILLELTDRFRARPDDLQRTLDVATELDTIQARARFSIMTDAVEPILATDGSVELNGARHPLLMRSVAERLLDRGSGIGDRENTVNGSSDSPTPVPRSLIGSRPFHRIDHDELAWRAHPLEPESKLLFEGGHDPGRAWNCRGVAGDLVVAANDLFEVLTTLAVIRIELEHEAEGGRIRDAGPIDDRGVKEPAQNYDNLRRAEPVHHHHLVRAIHRDIRSAVGQRDLRTAPRRVEILAHHVQIPARSRGSPFGSSARHGRGRTGDGARRRLHLETSGRHCQLRYLELFGLDMHLESEAPLEQRPQHRPPHRLRVGRSGCHRLDRVERAADPIRTSAHAGTILDAKEVRGAE